jgi:hypothetical protein
VGDGRRQLSDRHEARHVRELRLGVPKLLFGALPVLDVEVDAELLHDFAGRIPQRHCAA